MVSINIITFVTTKFITGYTFRKINAYLIISSAKVQKETTHKYIKIPIPILYTIRLINKFKFEGI